MLLNYHQDVKHVVQLRCDAGSQGRVFNQVFHAILSRSCHHFRFAKPSQQNPSGNDYEHDGRNDHFPLVLVHNGSSSEPTRHRCGLAWHKLLTPVGVLHRLLGPTDSNLHECPETCKTSPEPFHHIGQRLGGSEPRSLDSRDLADLAFPGKLGVRTVQVSLKVGPLESGSAKDMLEPRAYELERFKI